MTEQELLDLVRRQATLRGSGPQLRKGTAAQCRACFAENDGSLEKCRRCGRPLQRARAGSTIACPEATTEAPDAFLILVGAERRAFLRPGDRLVIGRGEDCDVWLEESTVSRRHLEIVWDHGAALPRFRDLGSSNGTRFHGRLRSEGLLETNASVEIGPYRISLVREVRKVEEPAVAPLDLAARSENDAEFEGTLGSGVASLVLRALAIAERTGTLEFALDRGTGSVVLAEGRVAAARCGRTIGLAALHVILTARKGAYRFRGTFELDDLPEVDLSVEEVLAAVPV